MAAILLKFNTLIGTTIFEPAGEVIVGAMVTTAGTFTTSKVAALEKTSGEPALLTTH